MFLSYYILNEIVLIYLTFDIYILPKNELFVGLLNQMLFSELKLHILS